MVESNASLPQLRDYVNFSSDRELMSLIGQGKQASPNISSFYFYPVFA